MHVCARLFAPGEFHSTREEGVIATCGFLAEVSAFWMAAAAAADLPRTRFPRGGGAVAPGVLTRRWLEEFSECGILCAAAR